LIVTTNQASSIGVDVINSGTGVSLSGKNTAVNNQFPAVQAEVLSNNIEIGAIFGNNKGAGYGVMGQIDVGATGSAGVYGSNLRTDGGFGVLGIGLNGIVGQSSAPNGYGTYGINLATPDATGDAIGAYGMGYIGVVGQTSYTGGYGGVFTARVLVQGDVTATTFTNASDERLKSNIIPIENALDNIMLLKPKHYTITMKSTPNLNDREIVETERQEYGVIAQDLEKIYPGMVSEKAIFQTTGDNTKYKTVNYIQLIPVLIEAIKELNDKVDTNQTEIEILKQKIKILESK